MEGKQLRVLVVTFWSGSSTSDFYKIIKVPIAILRWIQFKTIIYLDDMLQISQTINGLDIARDILIFLLQTLGFVINRKKSVLVPLQKIEFLGLEIESVRIIITLPPEEIKKLRLKCQKLISNPRTTLRELTDLMDYFWSTADAVLPAMLQIRFLQQQQIAAIRNNPSYQIAMYLNQDSVQELQWWFNNLEICNGKLVVSPTSKGIV